MSICSNMNESQKHFVEQEKPGPQCVISWCLYGVLSEADRSAVIESQSVAGGGRGR